VSYRVIPSERFKREARRLAKKYPSLASELAELTDTLADDPQHGTSLGFGLYKIRLAIRSKGKGKSGGGRVITYFVDEDHAVYLVTIYDKGEVDTLSTNVLREYVRELHLK
jgi:mRNA-degrading endonuclease RelE of RelBE toxin-antitoxin system